MEKVADKLCAFYFTAYKISTKSFKMCLLTEKIQKRFELYPMQLFVPHVFQIETYQLYFTINKI